MHYLRVNDVDNMAAAGEKLLKTIPTLEKSENRILKKTSEFMWTNMLFKMA